MSQATSHDEYQEIDSNKGSMQKNNQESSTDSVYFPKRCKYNLNKIQEKLLFGHKEIWILQLCIGPPCVLVSDFVHADMGGIIQGVQKSQRLHQL